MQLLRQACFAVLLTGCASYPERTAGAFHDFQRGHFVGSIEAYADPDYVGSDFLSGAEAGMVALAAGEWGAALEHLDRAAEASREVEGRALAGKERFGEFLASWALNDTQRAYRGEGFERVYLHCGMALAYLALGELEDVGVEVRLANQLLEAEEELYDKQYAAGGFGHLISAIAYELDGQLDQAYIDYERMVEKGVGTQIAGRSLVRIANELGREDEARHWEGRYGPASPVPPGSAVVLLLAGVGLGPFKAEGNLVLPTHDGLLTFAAPAYRVRPQPVSNLRLRAVELGKSVRSDVIERVSDVAQRNLEDRLLWIAAKSVTRGILKRELTKELEDEYGLGGRIAGDLFAALSERADLRAWQTLPDTWQASRLFVPAGVHTFTLDAVGGGTSRLGTFELESGETLVVLARSIGPRLYAHPIGGRLVSSPAQGGIGERAAALDVP